MAQLLIRNLDDTVVAALKRRARAHSRSTEAWLREVLTAAARPRRAERLAELERIRRMTPAPLIEDSAELIGRDRARSGVPS